MDNKQNEDQEKVQSRQLTADVLDKTEEDNDSSNLIETSEKTTPETCRAGIDGN